jgi:hypothetical protein
MAEMDDKELFSSAMTDEPTPETVTETPAEPAQEAPQQDGRPRDEHGRFVAPRGAHEPEPTPEPQQPTAQQPDPAGDDGKIPPWRLREMRIERDDAIQRSHEMQRQLEMLRQQMPKPEPAPRPDLYENPDGAIKYGVQEYVDPQIQQLRDELAQIKNSYVSEREEISRERAIEKYGEEAVRNAYVWVAEGIQKGDPNVAQAYNQVMQSRKPFDRLVQVHQEISLMQQIKAAGGVEQWRAQQLVSGQPQQQSRPQPGQPQGSNIKLPTSLRSVPSARSNADDDDNDMSDAALFRHATR